MTTHTSAASARLIAITQQLLIEIHTVNSQRTLTLNDSLQGRLGLDSISRAELSSRIEKEFNIALPLQAVSEAETLADLLNIIATASPALRQDFTPKTILPPLLEGNIADVSTACSLQEVLIMHAAATPQRPHMYLQNESGQEEIITYQKLLHEASRVAHTLKKLGLETHETVAIMLPTQAEFFYIFMGILLAGGIPVPVYPPARAHQLEEYAHKEVSILNNAGIKFLITFPQAKQLSQFLQPFVPTLEEVLTIDKLFTAETEASYNYGKLADIALIQYTSGSTNLPKGVTLTHYNLLSNIRAYGEAIQITPKDVCISWLPLYHDLGLIGNWLGSLYFGATLVSFSPLIFLSHPEKWLWAIHNHRGTLSAGPNFSYELCVRKIDEAKLEGLNLNSWRLAINGAETIYPKTLNAFAQKFAPYGFKPEAFLPVYGLAENSLGLTTPELGQLPIIDTIDRKSFERNHRAVPVTITDSKQSLQFVCCGQPLPNHELRVVDSQNKAVPERSVGHIQFRGPSSMQGYYNNTKITQQIFHDGWWDTGDLGYLAKGDIYITGRSKDIIIKAGRNLFASEIEDLVGQISGVRQGCVIAFSLNDSEKGTDQLIIVAEKNPAIEPTVDLKSAIIEKITTNLDVTPDDVVLVAPRVIPKTSSGKLQRNACKTLYLNKKLHKKTLPASLQYLKIGIKSFITKARNYCISLAGIFYTFYIAVLVSVTFIPIWLILKIGSQKMIDVTMQKWTRIICILSFCPQKIINANNLTTASPVIFVANHSSYLDVALLAGLVPAGTRFVGKRSLFNIPVLKTILNAAKHIPVDKDNSAKSIDDINRLLLMLRSGESILIFPEGTFSSSIGLRPFKLSAFKIAADMNIPICPIAIQGTRKILRGNEFIMQPHAVKVTIGPLFYATGSDWNSIIELKNQVYTEILDNCGEPSLDFIVPNASAKKT